MFEDLLSFSEPYPKIINGQPRKLRCATATPQFWDAWAKDDNQFIDAGIRPGKTARPGSRVALIYQLLPPNDPPVNENEHQASARRVVKIHEAVFSKQPLPPKTESNLDLFLSLEISSKLRPWQIESVKTLSKNFQTRMGQLDASSMGVGKTYTAIALCALNGWKPFVLCRKSAIPAWIEVADLFRLHIRIANYESAKRGGKDRGGVWEEQKARNGKIIDVFRWDEDFDTLICDEVHVAKGATLNSKMLISAFRQGKRVLGLSATPGTDPRDFRALGYVLGLHNLNGFYSWCFKHGCENGNYGLEFTCGLPYWERTGEKGIKLLAKEQKLVMDKIHQDIFDCGKGIRVDSSSIPGFPDNEIIPMVLDFSDAVKIDTILEAMKYELDLLKAKKGSDGQNHLTIMMRARQEIELIKVPVLAEEIRNDIAQGYSVAVFVNFTESRLALAKALKTDCQVFGGQSSEDRQACLDKFQSNNSKIIVLNTQAGCESIGLHDLHGGHPRVAYVCPSFWAESIIQSIGRIPRSGSKSPCITKIPFAAFTIEEQAYRSMMAKRENISTLVDGDLTAGVL